MLCSMLRIDELKIFKEEIIDYLAEIQNADGSFGTYYLQPEYNPSKGWMKFPGNAPYDTASTILPLLSVKSEKAAKIVKGAKDFLINQSLDNFLWTYAYETENYLIPYDTDSTSLASLVLTRMGYAIENKGFLNSLINEHGYYPFYVWLNSYNGKIPFLTFLKMMWRDREVKKCIPIVNDDMRVTDAEFTSTCINLLYLGKTHENEIVWQRIKHVLAKMDIDHMYYIDLYHSFYHVCRLAYYSGYYDVLPEKAELHKYLLELKKGVEQTDYSDRLILFANSLLFLNKRVDFDATSIWNFVREKLQNGHYKELSASYSSNVNTDYQKDGTPNTYFGSYGVSAAHYLEFLLIYKELHFSDA